MKIATGIITVGLVALLGAAAFAQNAPYRQTWPQQPDQTNTARIFLPPMTHPQVAVSRTLAAQPVHPYMVQVVIGGSGDSGPLTTWIDPLARLDGAGRLDESHSLVKSQRLFNSLRGVTTEQINALRNDSLARQPRATGANCARLIYPAQAVGRMPSTMWPVLDATMPQANPPAGRIIVPRHYRPLPQRHFDLKIVPDQPRPAKPHAQLARRAAEP